MTSQDLDVGVARRLWRQGRWVEDEDAGSGICPGCLSMVQSYSQNWPVPRVVGVMAGPEVWGGVAEAAGPQGTRAPGHQGTRAREEQFRGQQLLP